MVDYYQILMQALQSSQDRSPQIRNEIYNRAHGAVVAKLKQIEPPVSESTLEHEIQLFREAVARIEKEIEAAAQKSPTPAPAQAPPLTVVGGTSHSQPPAQARPLPEISLQIDSGVSADAPNAQAANAAPAGAPIGTASAPTAQPQGPAAATPGASAQGKPPQAPVKKKIIDGDQEFLPAALEILETPPSPVRIRMLGAICLFVVIALAWSYFGHIDIVAVAQGKFQPTGRVNVVQPLETGKVRTIHVANGSRVSEGQILVEMDPSDAQSDVTAQGALLASLNAEIARRQAAHQVFRSKSVADPPAINWPEDLPDEARLREQRVYDSDIAQLRAVVASIEAQRAQKAAEEARVSGTITAQEQFVMTLKERVEMREALVARAAGARANVIDALERLNEQQTQLAIQRGQLKETQASLVVLGKEIDKHFQNAEADNNQRLSQAQRQRDDIEQRLAKATARLRNTLLRAPNAGTVQALSVINVGQVVAAGEQIMRVVPDGLGLEIEGYVLNKDIGFIKEGLDATIKIDSFPFTKWGTIEGKVIRIARDAIPLPEAIALEGNPAQAQRATGAGGAQRTQNLVYQVTLKPMQDRIGPPNDQIQLMPGMTVTLEIKTGSRRIISYLFTPLVEVGSAAMRER